MMLRMYFGFHSCLKRYGVSSRVPVFNFSSHQKRNFSSDGDHSDSNKGKLSLMKYPLITWPNALLSLRNFVYASLLIRPFYDPEFTLKAFTTASKHAVVKVSEELSRGNFEYLKDLVDPKALKEVKQNFERLTLTQRRSLTFAFEDIFFTFPYQLGMIYTEEGKQRVFAEITMCYHILEGYGQNQSSTQDPQELAKKLTIANYRFIRELTKGTEDSWTINIMNHYKPHEHGPMGPVMGGKFK